MQTLCPNTRWSAFLYILDLKLSLSTRIMFLTAMIVSIFYEKSEKYRAHSNHSSSQQRLDQRFYVFALSFEIQHVVFFLIFNYSFMHKLPFF